jgi:hemolysin activation/secretion protein
MQASPVSIIVGHFNMTMKYLRGLLCASLLTAAFQTAYADQPPTGGELLKQVPPPAPLPQASEPNVTVTRPEAGSAAPGPAFQVEHIDITGATDVPIGELRAIVAPSEGKMLSLADLQRLADAITARYMRAGYPFSQAYVPAQTVRDGHVSIAVLEAHYDNIVLNNSSRVRDFVPQATLSDLKIGMPVDQATLDKVLLLISDLPATTVKGTLRPGQTVGASELQVDVAPGPLFNGNVSADDYGNSATGRERLNANVNLLEPFRLGDALSASVLSAGRGMNYGRLGYQVPLDGMSTLVEAHVSTLEYELVHGSEVPLDARGTASVFGLGFDQILLRSTTANVNARLTYEDTQLDDRVEVSDIHTDRHTEDWHALVAGSVNDRTGVSAFNAGLTLGRVVYDDPTALGVDYAGARTEGKFTKYVLSVSRLQRITEKTALFASVSYQGANKNLDSSEQFFVGGPSSVEAYDNGVISGAQGNAEALELRRDLHAGRSGQWQGTVFFDHAHVQFAKDPYSEGANAAALSAAGVALDWTGPSGWAVTSSLATPVGGTPEVLGHRPTVRFWLQLQKSF